MNNIKLNMHRDNLKNLSESEVLQYVDTIIGNVDSKKQMVAYQISDKTKIYKLDDWGDLIDLIWDIYKNDYELNRIEKVQKLITLFANNYKINYFNWDDIMHEFLIPFNLKKDHEEIYNSFDAVYKYNEFMANIKLVDKKQDELLGFKLIDLSKWNDIFTQMAKEDSIINVLKRYTGKEFEVVINALKEEGLK